MKRIINFLLAGLFVSLLIFSACEKVVYPPPEPPPAGISYADTIQPIWDAKCVFCHNGSRSPDLRPENSHSSLVNGGYVNVEDPPESELMKILYDSHSSRATEAEKLLILAWIEEGALDN